MYGKNLIEICQVIGATMFALHFPRLLFFSFNS